MPATASRLLVAAGLLLMACAAHAGEIYQWKDAKGVTHYSDSPPPNQSAKARTVRTAQGTAPAAAAPAAADSPQCTIARNNLKQIDSGVAIGVDNNGDGKPDGVLDAQQRAAQKQLAQSAITVHCTPSATPATPAAPAADTRSARS